MFKKIMAIILALSMAICLAACGNNSSQSETDDNQSSTSGASETTPVGEPEGNESEKTEEPTFELSGEGKSMSELLAEANPANKYEELAAAHKICQSRFDLAVVSTEKVGLTEDSTMSGLIEEFGQQLGNLRDFLKEYEETGQEELNALDDNSDFMYYADYYLSALTKLYNMTSAIAKDPVLWLERYTLVPQSLAEEVESDGSWPEGYFFSDRVPAIENIDSLLVSETGKEYGFADGIEYTIGVNQFGEDQALTYIDQLMDAGFREDAKEEMYGTILWLGRLDVSEGHVSAIIVYNGSAAGTAVDPAFMVQFYNCDMIGIMLDIGTIY